MLHISYAPLLLPLAVLLLCTAIPCALACQGPTYAICFQSAQHTLDCSSSSISSLPCVTNTRLLSRLKYLDLSGNALDVLEVSSLSSFVRLHTLHLSRNNITEVQTGALAGLSNLKHLSLAANHIASLPFDLFLDTPLLEHLDLSGNFLTDTWRGMFRGLAGLAKLDLSYNKLTKTNPESLSELISLTSLNMSGNQLTELTSAAFGSLRHLEELDLSGNVLATFHFGAFDRLQSLLHLNISGNHIQTFFLALLRDTHALKELRLNRNWLTAMPFEGVRLPSALKTLDLSDNFFTTLDKDLLKPLRRLSCLHLHNNLLSALPAPLLAATKSLEHITLHGNKLSQLEPTTFQGTPNLQALTLFPNNLDCCDLSWTFHLPTPSLLCDVYTVTAAAREPMLYCSSCSFPASMRGVLLQDATNTSAACSAVHCPLEKPAFSTLPTAPRATSLPCDATHYGATCPIACMHGYTASSFAPAHWHCGSDGAWHTEIKCIDTILKPARMVGLRRTFAVSARSLNRKEAEEACVERGGHLLSVETADEESFQATVYDHFELNLWIWIGLHVVSSIPPENPNRAVPPLFPTYPEPCVPQYKWTDGSSFGYEVARFQPTRQPSFKRPCVVMAANGKHQHWLSVTCTSPRRFICEFPTGIS